MIQKASVKVEKVIIIVLIICGCFTLQAQTYIDYVSTLAGSTGGYLDLAAAVAQFNQPTGVAVDVAGNVYVADQINHRIRKITPTGNVSQC